MEQSKAPDIDSCNPVFIRKKHRLEGQRICRVCGDKAVAYNFDVISCESCKTFFRRNAHKEQRECAFEGVCEITVQTRRFCPACRLKKCLNIGMRADMILDEAGRQARMTKIVQNRKKRLQASQSEICSSLNTVPGPPSYPEVDKVQDASVTFKNTWGDNFPACCCPTEHTPAQSVEELVPFLHETATSHQNIQGNSQQQSGTTTLSGDKQLAHNDLHIDQKYACTFQHVPTALLPSDPMMYWLLTAEEHNLITLLTVAYKETLMQLPSTPEALSRRLENISLEQTLAYCDRFAPDMVSFLKRMPDFLTLQVTDQLATVKANAMLIMLLKSAACFAEERDSWIKDFGEVPVSMFARVSQHEELVGRYAHFCRTLKRILKNDYSAFMLLKCLVLFDPQAPNLIDRQTVNKLQDKYSILLKHYLESQFSFLFASIYHDTLQEIISMGRSLAADMTAMFSVWKNIMDPLMVDIMNLA